MPVSVPHSLSLSPSVTATAPQNSLSYTSGDERDGDKEAVYDEDAVGEDEDEDASMAASELSNSSSSAFTPSSNSWRSHCGPAAPRTCQARRLPPLTDLALSSFLESRDECHIRFFTS